MNKKQQHIPSLLRKLSVLVLYASFFVAQLSFNYSIGSQLYASYVQANTKNSSTASIKQVDKHNDTKVNIRLNKRFQPESFVLGDVPVAPAPINVLLSKPVFGYTTPIILHSQLIVGYLRGPPAMHLFIA
ncbi:hypothetical protein [Parasediminibacterium sp. JCM 36343]|uniref:hypothetical protein n=1 Tax=Parasediminibacterium sp. JCM 36343 TaxID=3374279 RepID=UPI00397E4DDF